MYIYGCTTVSYEFADEQVRTEINRRTITLTRKKKWFAQLFSGIICRNMKKSRILI